MRRRVVGAVAFVVLLVAVLVLAGCDTGGGYYGGTTVVHHVTVAHPRVCHTQSRTIRYRAGGVWHTRTTTRQVCA